MPVLYILDVKHGNSTVLIDTKGIVVIDTGLRSDLLQFLVDNELTKIDVLILSHADKDHIGGAIGLLAANEFEIKNHTCPK
jgi:beta-lactamase superfamily II metal-dependent hydrolase